MIEITTGFWFKHDGTTLLTAPQAAPMSYNPAMAAGLGLVICNEPTEIDCQFKIGKLELLDPNGINN